MKKMISIILIIVMAFTMMMPSFAALDENDTPIVILRGDGGSITKIDENGTEIKVYPLNSNKLSDEIGETAVNILIPFLTEGLLFDKWDNYYKVCYEELAPIMADVILDENGNPRDNSGIGSKHRKDNADSCKTDVAEKQGYYSVSDYTYHYDWRIDPADVIDDLHTYIKTVVATTGRKVTLAGNCLGGSYVLAYLQKYGTEGYVKNVFFNATVGNGTSILTDIFCGDIEIDAKSIQRFADEYIDADSDTIAGLVDVAPVINEVLLTTIDLLTQLGLLDKLGGAFDDVYNKVYEVLVPMLIIAFYGTMPGYWTMIEPDRFEEAKDFVFGPEGSEYRTKYAGLIEKIDDYYKKVSLNKKEIIEACQAAGIHFGATAKYGVQMYPFVKSQDQLSDEMVDLHNASFGATVAPSVYDVLPDSPIEGAIINHTDKYISPDNKIDASTSLFKDSLWIEKNIRHDTWTFDYAVIEAFSRNDNFTVNSDPNFPQYVIRIPDTGEIDPETGIEIPETSDIVPMTKENCDITIWDEIPEETKTEEATVFTKLMSFFRWLTAIIKFVLHIANDNPGSVEDLA